MQKHLFYHQPTGQIVLIRTSATRHILDEHDVNVSTLPDIDYDQSSADRVMDEKGTPRLNKAWQKIEVFVRLPSADGGYIREWNDEEQGAVSSSGGFRPALGYTPIFRGSPHPQFPNISQEQAIAAWEAAGKPQERVFIDF